MANWHRQPSRRALKTFSKLEGLSALEATFTELGKSITRGVLKRAVKAAVEPIQDLSEKYAPVATGNLKNSFVVTHKRPAALDAGKQAYAQAMRETRGDKKAARSALRDAYRSNPNNFAEVFFGTAKSSRAAVPQEFGTENHPAQPFMRPGWDEGKQEAAEILSDTIKTELDKAVARKAKKMAKKNAK